MKTVGDFKKAGLVFVEGDVVACHVNGVDNMEKIGRFCDDANMGCGETWTNSQIESFAWRTNTGEKPSFEGLVEIKVDDDFIATRHTERSLVGWDSSGIKWRPSLNQGEHKNPSITETFNEMFGEESPFYKGKQAQEKPAYTKAMQEAGLTPSVGMKCMFKDNGSMVEGLVLVTTERFIIFKRSDGIERVRVINSCTVEPIQTKREKAIATYIEKLDLTDGVLVYLEDVLGKLIDLELLK